MEEPDFDEDLPVDVRASVARYEEMVLNQSPVFFDLTTYEHIVNFYEQREEWKQALQVLDYAIEQHPYSAYLLIKKAGLIIYYRKYKQALELLDQAEILDGDDISIDMLRSDIYLEKNQPFRSIKILVEAIRKCEDDVDREDLKLELADVYEELDAYETVFQILKEVLEKNVDNEEALSRMWYCVELAGKQDESIALHKKIIDERPYSYLAWHNLGNAYFDKKMFAEAIEAYEFVTAINESWDLAYRDCGEAFFQLKMYEKAIDQFQKAIEASKPYEELYFSIGVCHEKLKDYNSARTHYRKAGTVDPKYSEAFYRIAETFKKEKQWEQAVHFYKKALRILPENADYLLGIAQSFYNLGEIDPFIFACQSVMAMTAPAKKKSHYEKLVSYLVDLGCIEDALQLMDFASVEKGTASSFPFIRAACYFKIGNRREAIAWLEEGLSANYAKHQLLYRFAPELKKDAIVSSIIEQYK